MTTLFDVAKTAPELRDYQQDGIERLRESFRAGHKRPMMSAPTGSGKTACAAAIINLALARGSRIAFTVPRLDLIDQSLAAFGAAAIHDIGVMQGQHFLTNPDAKVQVISVQTLARRGFPDVDLVVVDEAHMRFEVLEKWMAAKPALPFVGLSATPGSKGLGLVYDDLVTVATTKQLIERGFLSPFRVFAPSHPNLDGVKTVAGDYHEGQLSDRMNTEPLVADVVETWMRLGEGRPTLVFGVNQPHAKHLQQRFLGAGVPCGYQDANTPALERKALRDQFQRGEIKVIANCETLCVGVDLDVRCISLCRPTKSPVLLTQIVGRGLRTAPGKADCLARDTLILTDRGEVKIQDVTIDHKVWDGVAFVAHSGAICRGVHGVIEHDGIIGTPDHKVMTDVGWHYLSQAKSRRLGITRSGVGRNPIRVADNHFQENGRGKLPAEGRSSVRSLFSNAYDALSQFAEAARYSCMSVLQWTAAGLSPQVALPKMSKPAREMRESLFVELRALWGARNTVSFQQSERSSYVGCSESGYPGRSHTTIGPDRQQWPLRAGKSPVGDAHTSNEQHEKELRSQEPIYQLSAELSASAVRGCDVAQADPHESDRRTNCRAMEHAFVQTEREVWDILDAGPLQRFTANGRLVHNCLILDHSDSTLRLGFVTDIKFDRLDDGKKAAPGAEPTPIEPPKPVECPSCGFVRPARSSACPFCGFKTERQSKVEEADGELVELTKTQRKRNRTGVIELQGRAIPLRQFYAELQGYAAKHGYRGGWASNKYKTAIGVWPNKFRQVGPATPSYETDSWCRAQAIRFAKAKRKQENRRAEAAD